MVASVELAPVSDFFINKYENGCVTYKLYGYRFFVFTKPIELPNDLDLKSTIIFANSVIVTSRICVKAHTIILFEMPTGKVCDFQCQKLITVRDKKIKDLFSEAFRTPSVSSFFKTLVQLCDDSCKTVDDKLRFLNIPTSLQSPEGQAEQKKQAELQPDG